MASFQFAQSNKTIEAILYKELKNRIAEIEKDLSPKIAKAARLRLKKYFDNDDTINSILGNNDGSPFSLQQEFGLTDDLALESAVRIVDAIVESVSVRFIQRGSKVIELGRIELAIIPGDFQKNLANTTGLYISRKWRGDKETDILWLNWLLLQGTRIIIDDYHVAKSGSYSSRAGGALMRKGGIYRVDPKHAGSLDDNFITRGIDNVLPDIIADIQKLIAQL